MMAAPLDGDPPDAASTAMNGNDTIVLQASPFAGVQRIKRLKTEHTPTDATAPYHTFQNGHTVAPAPPAPEPAPPLPTPQRKSPTKSRSREATQTPKSPSNEPRVDGPVLRKTKIPSLRLRLSQTTYAEETQSFKINSASKRRNIDFRAAPSSPSEFAWWIAQQVRQASPAEAAGRNLESSLPDFEAMTSVMRPLPPPTEDDPDLVKAKEKEKQRTDNRERKKRWREINAERNKDNDLRCRVTKLAKTKYGDEDTEEKLAFIEREFESRRAKRAEKEKRNASYRGTLSAFRTGALSPTDLKEALRASLKNVSKKSVETAAMQLIEIVVDAAVQQLNECSLETAQSLQQAIASGATDAKSVEEAARILAASEDLRRAFEEGPDDRGSAEPENMSIEDNEQTPRMNGHRTGRTSHVNGTGLRESPEAIDQSANPTGKLNAAVRTLNGIGRPKRSTSSRRPTEKARAATRRKHKKPRLKLSKPSAKHSGVDTNSIDALLALANGGSIFDNDDDDEESSADPSELVPEDLSFVNTTTDEALNNVLERVAIRIVRDRVERDPHPGPSSTPGGGDAYETHAVREQVLKMKAFVSEAGVGVNTLVPSTEAQALSELYAQLLKHIERERTPPEDSTTLFRSAAWSGFGAKPSDQPSTSDSHRSPEEQRKILTYGFPPLPGQGFVAR